MRPLCISSSSYSLDHKSLDLVLESTDLAHKVGSLVSGDGSSNNSAANTTSTAQSHLGRNVNVRDVLVFAEKRDVEQDGERGGVGGQDDNLGDTTVEGLGCLVGALLQLAVVRGLLDEVEDALREGGVTAKGISM